MTMLPIDNLSIIRTSPNGVQKLRDLIVNLAIMGKLVPQDPHDEPAASLLKRSEAERAKRAIGNKPAPPGGNGVSAFELPIGWEWTTFPQIGELARGKSKHRPRNEPSLFTGGKYPFVQTGDIARADGVVHSYSSRYNDKGLAQSRLWPKETMCITIAANIADTAILGMDACFPDSVVGFVPFDSEVDVRFFCMFMETAKSHLEDFAPSTAQKNINLNILQCLKVPLPPLKEMKRIVAKTEELLALCDKIDSKQTDAASAHMLLVNGLLAALTAPQERERLVQSWNLIDQNFSTLFTTEPSIDALKQAILQLSATGLLVRQDPRDEPASKLLKKIGETKVTTSKKVAASAQNFVDQNQLPDGWEICRFEEIAIIRSELVSPECYQDYEQVAPDSIEKGTGRLIQRRTVKDAGIISPNHHFYAGQILYSKIRPSLSKAVLVDFEGLCSADMYPIEAYIIPKFLLIQMLSATFLDQVRAVENRVKMPKLNQASLNSFSILVPPLAEQTRIVEAFEKLTNMCDQLKTTVSHAYIKQEQLSNALVAHVFEQVNCERNKEMKEPTLVWGA